MYREFLKQRHVFIQLAILTSLWMGMTGCGSPRSPVTHPTLQPTLITTATAHPPVPTDEEPIPTATLPSGGVIPQVIDPQNASKVKQLTTFGYGMINGAPFYSTDGHLLVIPTTIGIDFYDAVNLRKLKSIPTLSDEKYTLIPAYPRLVTLSPDGRLLAADLYTLIFNPKGGFQEDSIGKVAIYIWNVEDGSLISQIPISPESTLADLAFFPDGQNLAIGFETGIVQVWHIADSKNLYSIKGSRLEFSPDGKLLITMPSRNSEDNHIYVYNVENRQLLKALEGERAIFSPNGLLAIENEGAVRLVDIDKGIALRAFNGKSAGFSADGGSLALLDLGRIRIYHVADGSLLRTMEGGFEVVYNLQFAPDGQTLAVVGDVPMCPNCLTAPRAMLWRISDGSPTNLEIQNPLWLTYAPKEGYLVIWAIETIHILNPNNASTVTVFEEYATSVDGIAFSPDEQTLAANSGQPNLSVRLWRIEDGRLVKHIEDPFNPGYGNSKVLFSPDGKILWAQGGFWSPSDGERLEHLVNILGKEAPPYVPSSIAFSNDGSSMAIGYLEGYLQLWDLAKEKLVRKLEGSKGEVVSLAFSPDGKSLAAVYAHPDYIVQLWKVPEGKRLLSITGQEWKYVFTQAVFSPDGTMLATIAKVDDRLDQSIVELWRISDGQRLMKLDTIGVFDIAFSPDGKILATGSYDHNVRLWQTTDGTLLNTLHGHGDYITDVAFSPSGELLASGSNDGTVVLWGIGQGR